MDRTISARLDLCLQATCLAKILTEIQIQWFYVSEFRLALVVPGTGTRPGGKSVYINMETGA